MSNICILKVYTRWFQVIYVILYWQLCILVYVWGTSELVYGYTWKYIPFELIRYAHSFIYIMISELNNHYVSVNQARYATSVVAKYLDTAVIKQN